MIRGDVLRVRRRSAISFPSNLREFRTFLHHHSFEHCICGNQINYRRRGRRWRWRFACITANYKSALSRIRGDILFARTLATARTQESGKYLLVFAISTMENPACLSPTFFGTPVSEFQIGISADARASIDPLTRQHFWNIVEIFVKSLLLYLWSHLLFSNEF